MVVRKTYGFEKDHQSEEDLSCLELVGIAEESRR